MKWKNIGHEFDEIYESIQSKHTFYLFGAGQYGEAVYKELDTKIRIEGFIDNDHTKKGNTFLKKKIIGLDDLINRQGVGIIIAVSPYMRKIIIQQLMAAGYIYNQDFFTMEIFISVLFAYQYDKLYIPSISFLPSTKCNLNCEACLNFTPYLTQAMIRSWEDVKRDVDIFFECVDYIMLFHISGGEPFLYPYLIQLIEYIGMNYRKRIHFLRTVTNGTVLPKPELLEVLKKYDVDVTLDDYREAVPQYDQRFSEVQNLFEEYGVVYEINKAEQWIDLAPMTTDHSDWDAHRLEKYFEGCHVPWQELRNGRIYCCNYASYAVVAGFAEEREDEFFDLGTYDKAKLKTLMEFRMGYNEKGYTEFCKKCAGYVDINENIVVPAKQKKVISKQEVK